MNWSFYQIWNESLEEDKSERTYEPRERIWASELGGSLIDRYLKMTGTIPTNPPNPRSLRKFEAGNIWESIVGYVLKRAGLLQEQQTWLKYQYNDLMPVTGKLDFMAGGKPDIEKTKQLMSSELSWLPSFISKATINIVTKLSEKYSDGLPNIILEIKSCSSFMFDKYEKSGIGSPQHRLQLFHYLKALGHTEGHIVYISKDDARLFETGVFNPSPVEDAYKSDIEEITKYVRAKTQPPKEKPIVFNDDWGKFSANWKVAYSNYLTMLYGFPNQMAFDEKYKPIVERWNRVLARVKSGKELTDNNKQAIDEMEKNGFSFDKIKEGK